MLIRTLTPDDAEAFRTIRLNALQNAPHAFSESYEEESVNPVQHFWYRLIDKKNIVFGGFDDIQLGGIVCFNREEKRKLDHKGWIWGVYVEPGYRGTGLARQLMEAAIDYTRQQPGLELLYLGVGSTNQPARALYRACGFEVYGYEKRAIRIDNEYYDEELMVLDLRS
jgi:RimJ/RimL family protein N-acetyltransferase